MEFNKPDVLSLEGNLEDNFKTFKEEVEIYFTATETEKKPSYIQVARLKNLLGKEALKVYKDIRKNDNEQETVKLVFDTLEKFCTPKKNEIMNIYKFLKREQQSDEPFNKFYSDLKNLVRPCQFGEQEDKLLRAQLTLGLNSKNVQERLLREDISLEKTLTLCQTMEITERNMKELNEKNEVHQVAKYDKGTRKMDNNQEDQVRIPNFKCTRCGNNHLKNRCPAWGKVCHKCKKSNHFAIMCKAKLDNYANKSNNKCNEVTDTLNSTLNDIGLLFEVSTVCKVDSINNMEKAWYKTVCVEGFNLSMKLDTGSEVDIIPYSFAKNSNLTHKIIKGYGSLISFGGFQIKPVGYIDAHVETENKIDIIKLVVVKGNCTPILGLNSCLKLNLIKRVDLISNNKQGINVAPSEVEAKNELFNKYKDVFEGVGCFPDLCKIKLKDDAIPQVSSARRIPHKIKDKFQGALNLLVENNIITQVEEPVEWVNNIVVLEKPNGSLRICIDPTQLNKYIIRERYSIPVLEDLAPNLTNKKYFTILDLKDGFYHIKLDEESSKLCSFSTIFGTYRFLRAPFGLSCIPEIFQRLVHKYFKDIQGLSIYFDDLCIATETKEENDNILQQVIERARRYNIKFNFNKLQYCVNKVKYIGAVFSESGMQPDPAKIITIKNFKTPTSKVELQRFLGMINYLRNFVPNLASLTSPLRELLKKDVPWQWCEHHTSALDKIKQSLCSDQVLGHFNPSLPIEIQCDASQDAVGCCCMQNGRPIGYFSRSLTPAETEYAQIEKELLAICFSCKKFHNYIYGHEDVTIFTDHLPLLSIINKPICKIVNNRIRRLRLKILVYSFKLKFLPGKYMHVADFLSRTGIKDEVVSHEPIDGIVHCIESSEVILSDRKNEEFKEETKNDEVLSQVIQFCKTHWPKSVGDGYIKHFFKLKNDITYHEGLLYLNDRLIVPNKLRKFMISKLHETHIGVTKILQTARLFFYWPSMSSDIKNTVSDCSICMKYQRSKINEPLMPHNIPQLPFYKIGADIAEYAGKYYLVTVDFYSRWIDVFRINNKSSCSVIEKLKQLFSRNGIPRYLVADNQPFNSYEMKQFSQSWSFDIITSSPHYPKSNGLSEKAVGIVKNMLQKSNESKQDFELFLLNYRNSPVANLNYSPSQLLNSRHMRSKLPILETHLRPNTVPQEVYEEMLKNKEYQKMKYDRSSLKEAHEFQEGEEVYIQDVKSKLWSPGVVYKKLIQPRSYLVQLENKNVLRRNSCYIKKKRNSEPKTEESHIKSRHEQENQEMRKSSRVIKTPRRYFD